MSVVDTIAPPQVGDSATLSKTITEADLVLFAGVSMDTNPLHLDEQYAQRTRFQGRIAHGMLSAGLISAVIGTKLPGRGAIYLSQSLSFRAPVRVGQTVTATVTVRAKRPGKPLYELDTVCITEDGRVVVTGEALVLFEPPA